MVKIKYSNCSPIASDTIICIRRYTEQMEYRSSRWPKARHPCGYGSRYKRGVDALRLKLLIPAFIRL